MAAGVHTRHRLRGDRQLHYRASDSQLTSNIATVTITVIGANPPVAAADYFEVYKDSPPYWFGAPGVLANDSDPDNDTLTAELVAGASHGTLVLSGNGSFTYTPAAGYVGTDSFPYQASDGHSLSNVATVTVHVVEPSTSPPAALRRWRSSFSTTRSWEPSPPRTPPTIYQSLDGVTLGTPLQTVPGETIPGIHPLPIVPTFTTRRRLLPIAKVDSGDSILEQHEWNNTAPFGGGGLSQPKPAAKSVARPRRR
jgi:hypothetical protein